MKHLRLILAVLLLPLLTAFAWSFFDLAVGLGTRTTLGALPFWLGLGGYFIFQTVFFKPIRTYVFGHELTHALAGVLSGARLKSFKVSSSGGSVVLTKTNLVIALAPYFIPLYTVIVILLYKAGARFWPLAPYYPYFLFTAGFTLAFHFSLTHYALLQGQSDLKQFGVFFSGVFILLINFVLLAGLLELLFPSEIGLRAFFSSGFHRTVFICRYLYEKVSLLCSVSRSTK